MNSQGEIYGALKDDIPAEDRARLDGYLRGRAEASVLDERAEHLEALHAERAALRATHES